MAGSTVGEILAHLVRHRARTVLTITGLVVGIGALVLAGSLAETIQLSIARWEEANQAILRVRPTSWEQPLSPAIRRAVRRVPGVAGTVTTRDARLAEPETAGDPQASARPVSEWLWAIDSDIPALAHAPPYLSAGLLRGRWPAPGAAHEVLLSHDLAQAHGWDVGDTAWIRGRPFVVAGILERPMLSVEHNAYVDYDTLSALLRWPPDRLDGLDVIADAGQDQEQVAARIEEQVPGVRVQTPQDRQPESRQSLGLFVAIAGVSAGLALLAGTLTIVNTMLMSVRDRHREIGLKKALGAEDGDILSEFVLEAGMLGALGGGLAVLLAWFVVLGVNTYTRARWGWGLLSLTPRLAAGAVALSTLLGALAGAYPAWRAAQKDPVQALRNAPAAPYAGQGLAGLRYRLGRRARWLLTVAGISAGMLILTAALSVAEALDRFTSATIEATHDRLGLYPQRASRIGVSWTIRELARMDGVRGVVLMAYGGNLMEEGLEGLDFQVHTPQLVGLDSPTGEFGFGEPTRAGIARGRFLAPDSLHEVVVGPRLAETLGLEVGDAFAIRDRSFTVVGIWESLPDDLLTGYSTNAYITLAALRRLEGSQQLFPQITALVAPGTDSEALAAQIRAALPEWAVQTNQSSAAEMRQVMAAFSLILVGFVSLGLLAGGLSVMNTMLMAVSERTREIGLKKAVGAGDGDVLAEVIAESGWMGLLGGALGVVVAWLLTLAVNTFTQNTLGASVMLVTPRLAVGALAFTAFLGMVAGIYPAWRAARLDPVRALRSE